MQSYVLTLAPYLERLGHTVTVFSGLPGLMSDLAVKRGLRFCARGDDLPPTCEAVISNDAPSALVMAERYPDAVRGIVVHSSELDVHLPPAHDGVVTFAVVMNRAVERRVRASAHPPAIFRLTQPIDTAHLYPATSISERPQHLLLLGDRLQGRTRDTFITACETAGLTWERVGAGNPCADPFGSILAADIVVGLGRSALDAMACGRAVWVQGSFAGDGWVTRDSYAALEADGLRGRATGTILTPEDFAGQLAKYDPSMGEVNRELAVLRHSPYDHAVEMVEITQRFTATAPASAPLREMERLVRCQYDAQSRVHAVANELQLMRVQFERERQELREHVEWHRQRSEDLVATRRWRIAQRVAWPLDQGRRLLRRLHLLRASRPAAREA